MAMGGSGELSFLEEAFGMENFKFLSLIWIIDTNF